MADQKINELPTKTAPSTGDKMLMIGTAEEYQIDYDKLASAILDKLATKQYSELDTTAKTVLGALDELNGKNPFEANTESNIDYNDLTAGVHYCYTGCTNSPGDYQRVICLRGQSNQNYDRIQVAYGLLTGKMSLRSISTSDWTKWKTFSDDATLFAGKAIKSGDDLNDYTTPGIYRSGSSTVTASLLNMPEIFGSGFAMIVFIMSSSTNVQVIFTGDKMYVRFSNTGGWLKWFMYSGTQISS